MWPLTLSSTCQAVTHRPISFARLAGYAGSAREPRLYLLHEKMRFGWQSTLFPIDSDSEHFVLRLTYGWTKQRAHICHVNHEPSAQHDAKPTPIEFIS